MKLCNYHGEGAFLARERSCLYMAVSFIWTSCAALALTVLTAGTWKAVSVNWTACACILLGTKVWEESTRWSAKLKTSSFDVLPSEFSSVLWSRDPLDLLGLNLGALLVVSLSIFLYLYYLYVSLSVSHCLCVCGCVCISVCSICVHAWKDMFPLCLGLGWMDGWGAYRRCFKGPFPRESLSSHFLPRDLCWEHWRESYAKCPGSSWGLECSQSSNSDSLNGVLRESRKVSLAASCAKIVSACALVHRPPSGKRHPVIRMGGSLNGVDG